MQHTHPSLQRNASNRKVAPVFTLVAALSAFLILFFLAIVFYTEQYFVPYPAIGTVFSNGYSEGNFNQIQPGMNEAEILELVGEPLANRRMIMALNQGEQRVSMPPGSSAMWEYSQDNVNGIWDFAWLGRFVYFDAEGRVTGTVKWVFYD